MPGSQVIRRAARVLSAGGVIAYPTEGVYGLGCLPDNGHAVDRLLRIKGRSVTAGLILIAPAIEFLSAWIAPTAQEYRQLSSKQQQPITWIVTAATYAPGYLTGGRPTIAVRISSHPVVTELCFASGSALISTSANRSGRPAALNALAVRRQLGHELDFVVPGALGHAGGASEIRNAADNRVLRPGRQAQQQAQQ